MSKRHSAHARIYNRRWQKARLNFLTQHPLCRLCEQLGKLTRATVVDHITPHKGDEALFWDEKNWQGLCKTCHNSVKQRQEKSGVLIGANIHGLPVDPGHHWNR